MQLAETSWTTTRSLKPLLLHTSTSSLILVCPRLIRWAFGKSSLTSWEKKWIPQSDKYGANEERAAQSNLHKLFHSTAWVMRSCDTDPWICNSCHCILIICQRKMRQRWVGLITIELHNGSTYMWHWGNRTIIVLIGEGGNLRGTRVRDEREGTNHGASATIWSSWSTCCNASWSLSSVGIGAPVSNERFKARFLSKLSLCFGSRLLRYKYSLRRRTFQRTAILCVRCVSERRERDRDHEYEGRARRERIWVILGNRLYVLNTGYWPWTNLVLKFGF